MTDRKNYKDLSQDEKYKVTMLLREIRLIKGLMEDADDCTKEELAAERKALIDEVNKILPSDTKTQEIKQ